MSGGPGSGSFFYGRTDSQAHVTGSFFRDARPSFANENREAIQDVVYEEDGTVASDHNTDFLGMNFA